MKKAEIELDALKMVLRGIEAVGVDGITDLVQELIRSNQRLQLDMLINDANYNRRCNPIKKGLQPYSKCCPSIEMPNWDQSDICPGCKEHTTIEWVDEKGELVPDEIAFMDPNEDNTYN